MGKIHDYVNRLPRYVRWIIGTICIIVGIIGLILPIMPGLIFIIPGIYFLGEDTRLSRWMIGQIHFIRRKWHEKRQKKSATASIEESVKSKRET